MTDKLKITSQQVDRGRDHALIINPTEQPTDKKLTFREWTAKRQNINKDRAFDLIELYANDLNNCGGIHDGHCIGEVGICFLCELEKLLSEYHKYFKQK